MSKLDDIQNGTVRRINAYFAALDAEISQIVNGAI